MKLIFYTIKDKSVLKQMRFYFSFREPPYTKSHKANLIDKAKGKNLNLR